MITGDESKSSIFSNSVITTADVAATELDTVINRTADTIITPLKYEKFSGNLRDISKIERYLNDSKASEFKVGDFKDPSFFKELSDQLHGRILDDGRILDCSTSGKIRLFKLNLVALGNTEKSLIDNFPKIQSLLLKSKSSNQALEIGVPDQTSAATFNFFVKKIKELGESGSISSLKIDASSRVMNLLRERLDGSLLAVNKILRISNTGQFAVENKFHIGRNGFSSTELNKDLFAIRRSLAELKQPSGRDLSAVNYKIYIPNSHSFFTAAETAGNGKDLLKQVQKISNTVRKEFSQDLLRLYVQESGSHNLEHIFKSVKDVLLIGNQSFADIKKRADYLMAKTQADQKVIVALRSSKIDSDTESYLEKIKSERPLRILAPSEFQMNYPQLFDHTESRLKTLRDQATKLVAQGTAQIKSTLKGLIGRIWNSKNSSSASAN